MSAVYLFDVDGTLTDPRQKITKHFKKEFLDWKGNKIIGIISGSDFKKIKEQLPDDFLNQCSFIFTSMANQLFDKDQNLIYENEFELNPELEAILEVNINWSRFPFRCGNHIELRPGMVNFSTVGREADNDMRLMYNKWDNEHKERETIAKEINSLFGDCLEASIGGSISIDIIPKGRDKGQAIDYLHEKGVKNIVFFGDRLEEGGNDYGVVKKQKQHKNLICHGVKGPDHLLELLKAL